MLCKWTTFIICTMHTQTQNWQKISLISKGRAISTSEAQLVTAAPQPTLLPPTTAKEAAWAAGVRLNFIFWLESTSFNISEHKRHKKKQPALFDTFAVWRRMAALPWRDHTWIPAYKKHLSKLQGEEVWTSGQPINIRPFKWQKKRKESMKILPVI